MGSFEEELLLDAEDDARAVEYIRTHLSQELQEKISDDQLYYFLDLIFEYYAESGILDATPDADGYIDIDEEIIAEYLAAKANKEGIFVKCGNGLYRMDSLQAAGKKVMSSRDYLNGYKDIVGKKFYVR